MYRNMKRSRNGIIFKENVSMCHEYNKEPQYFDATKILIHGHTQEQKQNFVSNNSQQRGVISQLPNRLHSLQKSPRASKSSYLFR